MKKKLLFLFRYYLFWVGISLCARILFLFYQWQDTSFLSGRDLLHIIFGGLPLDMSLGGYILMVASLIMAVSPFFPEHVLRRIFSFLTWICLVFFAVVMTADLELFKNWGYHIDTTPLVYLKTPKEAMASTPGWLVVCLLLLMGAFLAVCGWVYRRWVVVGLKDACKNWWSIPLFLLIGGSMIIPVRGGFNVAPLNSSFVFFHPANMYANQAAINPVWNFVYELTHVKKAGKQYVFMPEEQAARLLDSVLQTGNNYPRILRTERPNIVFLLLESFTANAIEVLGGYPDVTPALNALAKEGILFSNIYATGSRSDRGIVAAISGMPSNPAVAMIKYPGKLMKYSLFPKELEAAGYTTRFYYAGDINFGGFRSYITMSFQSMVTEDDFSGEAVENRFKWGIHDQYMFDRLFEDMQKAPHPFMYMAFNMSSHEPFDVPGEAYIPGDDTEHRFLNAIHYSDDCIGRLITKCKASGLWENTLFILMADHGTRHIKHLDPAEPAAYHIPLILSGGALSVKDTVVTTLGSQTDMVATVLAQLGLEYSSYKYSRNLLADPAVPCAFYSYPNAAGLITPGGKSVLNLQSGQFIEKETDRNQELLKAWLQSVSAEMKP